MDYRVWLLALAIFFAGIDENVFIGILPGVASSLAVGQSSAGQLTTVFSFAYGITALMVSSLPYYPIGDGRGRAPVSLERKLRMYIVQQCFGLSDEGSEDAVYDNQP